MNTKIVDKNLRELLESLQPYPNMRFLLFASKWGVREDTILDFCIERDYELQLYKLTEFDSPNVDNIKSRLFKEEQKRYNLQGRLYDYLFVTGGIPDIKEWLKRVYSAVMNGGRVYIFLLEKDRFKIDEISEYMQESNYVSVNPIELSKDTIIISGKKMHGWGS